MKLVKIAINGLGRIGRHHIISAIAFGSIAFVAFNFSGSNSQPFFNSVDNFVLFASEEVKIEQETQVSSGDIGSNKEIDIQKDVIINGNLFADKITLDKNTTINGNISFNKLRTKKETRIFGTQTKPVQLPIANLPEVPDFQTGTQDFKFEGQNNTLSAGNYRNITLEKQSRLVLTGGVYNLDKFELKENSVLIFATTTILNIKSELKAQQKVSILPGQNIKFDDLRINFQDKKPIEFGKDSFLNFKLLAPKADVHIGEAAILRGQVLARKIKIEKEGILSREEDFEKESDLTKIISDNEVKFIVNEILILLKDGANMNDLIMVSDAVRGRVTGFLFNSLIGKIEVSSQTIEELNSIIDQIKSADNPLIEEVLPNALLF